MKSVQCQVSCCSRCRFYNPVGRRGGQCSQLGVPVNARWAPCSLATPVFATTLVEMKPLDFLPQPGELTFSDVFLEAAKLEAALEAPSVAGHLESASAQAPAPARPSR